MPSIWQETCARKRGGRTSRGVGNGERTPRSGWREDRAPDEEMSWERAAGVRLQWGLEAGDTTRFQRPARDLASNTSSVRSVEPGQAPGHREGQPGETRTELGMEARERRSSRPQSALEPETKIPVLKGCLEAQLTEAREGISEGPACPCLVFLCQFLIGGKHAGEPRIPRRCCIPRRHDGCARFAPVLGLGIAQGGTCVTSGEEGRRCAHTGVCVCVCGLRRK